MPYLTDAGLVAPRLADFLTLIRDDLDVRLGVEFDWAAGDANGDLLAVITAVTAARLDSLGEGLQAVWDARSRNNATGAALDNLGQIVGIARNASTYSQATVTLTGTTGTFIPTGSIVEGGGTNDDARWLTTADVTLAGSTGSVVVQASVKGRIQADASAIDKIVTPISGWTAVNNAAAATPGKDRETDSAYRARIASGTPALGGGSTASLRAKLLALDFVTAAVVLANPSSSAATVSGVSVPAFGVAVILYPNTLTDAQKTTVAETIFDTLAAGTPTTGAVSATVTDDGGGSQTVNWAWATTTTVNVATTITAFDSGYALADVQSAAEDAIEAYFDGLVVGEAARFIDLYATLAAITGIAGASLTLNAGSSDITPNANVLLVLGTNTVS